MLGTAAIVKIIMVAVGAVLCIFDFVSYSRQKLTEKFAFLWGVLGAAVILSGALPVLSGWADTFELHTGIAVVLVGFVVLSILFSSSLVISDLTRKNQELAMQVSLLNNENEQVLNAVHRLLEKDEQEMQLGEDLSWMKRRRYS
jgi:hypothetical protein